MSLSFNWARASSGATCRELKRQLNKFFADAAGVETTTSVMSSAAAAACSATTTCSSSSCSLPSPKQEQQQKAATPTDPSWPSFLAPVVVTDISLGQVAPEVVLLNVGPLTEQARRVRTRALLEYGGGLRPVPHVVTAQLQEKAQAEFNKHLSQMEAKGQDVTKVMDEEEEDVFQDPEVEEQQPPPLYVPKSQPAMFIDEDEEEKASMFISEADEEAELVSAFQQHQQLSADVSPVPTPTCLSLHSDESEYSNNSDSSSWPEWPVSDVIVHVTGPAVAAFAAVTDASHNVVNQSQALFGKLRHFVSRFIPSNPASRSASGASSPMDPASSSSSSSSPKTPPMSP